MMRHAWVGVLAGGTAVSSVAIALGETAQAVALALITVVGCGSLLVGARRHRPDHAEVWWLLAAAGSLFLIAGVIAEIRIPSGGTAAPYPGPNDLIDLLGYGLAVLAVGRIARLRTRTSDRTSMLDAIIVPGSVALLVWVFVMAPYLLDTELALAGRLLSLLFSVLSLTLAALLVRLAMAPGRRGVPWIMLGCMALAFFVGDLLTAAQLSGRSFAFDDEIALLVVSLGFVSAAVAALHPQMGTLTESRVEPVVWLTNSRVALLVGAAAVPPVALITQLDRLSSPFYGPVIGVAWILLTALIMVRMAGLVRARERAASRDALKARAAEALVAATDTSEVYAAALEATLEIVGSARGTRVSMLAFDDEWSVEATRAPESIGRLVNEHADADNPSFGLDGLRREVIVAHDAPAFDFAEDIAPVVAAFPLVARRRLRGALVLRMERELEGDTIGTLEALSRDTSLALDAAAQTEEMYRQRNENRFRILAANSHDLVAVVDELLAVRFISPAVARVLGHEEFAVIGQPLDWLVVPEDRPAMAELLSQPAEDRSIELRMVSVTGAPRWFDVVVSDLRGGDDLDGIVVTARDIHERKLAEARLLQREARFRSLVQYASDLVVAIDIHGNITYASPSMDTILGFHPDDVVGLPVIGFVAAESGAELSGLLGRLELHPDVPHNVELVVPTASGQLHTFDVTARDLSSNPDVAGVVLNAHDVTERKKLEHDLRHQTLHDALTGIPNRVLFHDRVEQALSRRGGSSVAVLVLDLDDFKTINDGLGHHAGDEILKVIAYRIGQEIRAGDTASRLGGDEFAVLLEDAGDTARVNEIARRILAKIAEPIDVGGRELTVPASLGIAFSTDITDNCAESMLRGADSAMYAAKGAGKGRFAIFEEAMHLSAVERLQLKADLTRALDREELWLTYQPIMDLASETLLGFEALLRWDHSQRGQVSPGTFIPIAEETGLILPIGRWVLSEAVRQLAAWNTALPESDGLSLSVNLSPRQLEDDGLVACVREVLDETAIDPAMLAIELTETASIDGDVAAREMLGELRETGVQLYADDFGSGYASYASIQHLPFTGVKIDRSLIDGLSSDVHGRALAQVRSIIEMAGQLDLTVTAEGIETPEQLQALQDLQCARGQGYHFSRPLSLERAERMLVAQRLRTVTPVLR